MSESRVGLMVPATRQKDGSDPYAGSGTPGGSAGDAGVNAPWGTVCATVMTVFGRRNPFSCSQFEACARQFHAIPAAAQAKTRCHRMTLNFIHPLSVGKCPAPHEAFVRGAAQETAVNDPVVRRVFGVQILLVVSRRRCLLGA